MDAKTAFTLSPFQIIETLNREQQQIDWGLKSLDIPKLWKQTKGEGIKIAVLDTGIAENHPDLKDAICEKKDFTKSPDCIYDNCGHGTHCAGIIAARHNSKGVVGVAPESKLIICKVTEDNETASSKIITQSILWAVENGADIISISMVSKMPSKEVLNAIKIADKKGVFVICAAGNEGPASDTVGYPACFKETITVSSTNDSKKISGFASRGKEVDIVAPGDNILSTYPPNVLARLSGTSMATPFVTGVCALILSAYKKNKKLIPINNNNDLRNLLKSTSIDLGEKGFDQCYGYGLINPIGLLDTLFKDKFKP